MKYGVLHSEVVLLIASKGIFNEDREYVTHVELKTGIDAGKAVIPIIGGSKEFQFDPKVDVNGRSYPEECVFGVKDDFQAYARAMSKALEFGGWKSQRFDRKASITNIVDMYLKREDTFEKLAAQIKEEREWLATETDRTWGFSQETIVAGAMSTLAAGLILYKYKPTMLYKIARLAGKTVEKFGDQFISMLVNNPLYAMTIFAFLFKLATGRRKVWKEWKRLRERALRY